MDLDRLNRAGSVTSGTSSPRAPASGRSSRAQSAIQPRTTTVSFADEKKQDDNNNNDNDTGNSLNEDGEAMVEAARRGDATAVSRYLLRGVPVDFEEHKGAYTALIKASRMQRVDVAKLLIINKADPNKASRNGWSALIEACRTGSEELSTFLLDLPSIRKDQRNAMGWTALVEACRNNHLHIVRLLCSRGANPYSVDEDGLIPKEHTSNTAIHAVLDAAYTAILESPDPHPAKSYVPADLNTPEDRLVDAAMNGRLDEVKKLLAEGVSVDAESSNGAYTPLIMSCRMGEVEVARYLLEQGAKINKQSKTGWTAFIEACRVGSMAVMYLLHDWDKGDERADMELCQAFGWPPIIEACRNGHYDVVEQLVEWGANVNHVDKDGDTPLDHSVHPWIIGLLTDQVKFGRMGPLSKMRRAYEDGAKMDANQRQVLLLNIVHGVLSEMSSAPPEDRDTAMWSMLSVVVQEFDSRFLTEHLLLEPGYKELISGRAFDFMQMVVSVALPDERRDNVTEFVGHVCDIIFSVATACAEGNSKRMHAFINAHNDEDVNAVLLCADKVGDYAYPVEADERVEETQFSWTLAYYWQLLRFLTSPEVGGDINSTNAVHTDSVLLSVLRPLTAVKGDGDFVNAYLHEFDELWRQVRARVKAKTMNLSDDENTALGYLVLANETDFRAGMLLEFMTAGALMPDAKVSQQRLLTLLESRMGGGNNEQACWSISRTCVRNNDVKLLAMLLKMQLPVFMSNPALDVGLSNTVRLPRFNPDRDDAQQEYCLLYMAIERLNREMFDMLFEYGSRATQEVYSRRDDGHVITYPWPNAEYIVAQESLQSRQKVNVCVVYRNPYGRNVFHVLAKKQSAVATDVVDSIFTRCMQFDTTAVVTRPDRYGWTPLHYAAHHNKTTIIEILIKNHVDLSQTTFDVGKHNKNRTALHIAAVCGNWTVVMSLLEARAKVDVIDKDGCTPLALAMIARQSLLEDQQQFHKSASLSIQNMLPSELQVLSRLVPGFVKDGGAAFARGVTRLGGAIGSGATALWRNTGGRLSNVLRWSIRGGSKDHLDGSITGGEVQAGDHKPTAGEEKKVTFGDRLSRRTGTGSQIQVAAAADGVEMVELLQGRNMLDHLNDMSDDDEDADSDLSDDSLSSVLVAGGDGVGGGGGGGGMVAATASTERLMGRRATKRREGAVASGMKASAKTKAESRKQTYMLTIQALLNHHASIAAAAEQSGRDLEDLIDVNGVWFNLCHSVYKFEQEAEDAMDEYYMFVRDHPEPEEFLLRQRKKVSVERETKVLESRRDELFSDRETQMVIRQRFMQLIRPRNFMKLIRYVVFLLTLTTLGIMQGTQDQSSAFWMVNTMEAKLTAQTFEPTLSGIPKTFDEIDDDVGEFFLFLKGPFSDALYAEDGSVAKYWDDTALRTVPGGLLGNQLYVLGRPRLRQIRSRIRNADECTTSGKLRQVTPECFTDATGADAEARTQFGPRSLNWTWSSEAETGGQPIWGRAGWYSGAGYTVDLRHPSETNARAVISALADTLETNGWVDASTRAVFLEMTLYNGNNNHFMIVSLLLEFPIGGGIVSSHTFAISRLKRDMTSSDTWIFALEIVVLVQMVLMFNSEILQALSAPLAYIQSVFNWVDMSLIVFAPIILGLRIAEGYEDVKWEVTTEYLHTQQLGRYQYVENILYAIMILLAWFKLFDYLSVFEELHRLIIMIEMMIGQLKNWLVVFCLVVVGFTTAEQVAFGYEEEYNYTWLRGFTQRIVGVFSGEFTTMDHTKSHRIVGMGFDLVFVVVTGMLLVNLIIALLTSAYEEAANYSAEELARRQYGHLEDAGYTKIKRLSLVHTGKEGKHFLETLDTVLLSAWSRVREQLGDVRDRCVAMVRSRSTPVDKEEMSSLRTTIRQTIRRNSQSRNNASVNSRTIRKQSDGGGGGGGGGTTFSSSSPNVGGGGGK